MTHNLPPQVANYDSYSTLPLWQRCIRRRQDKFVQIGEQDIMLDETADTRQIEVANYDGYSTLPLSGPASVRSNH